MRRTKYPNVLDFAAFKQKKEREKLPVKIKQTLYPTKGFTRGYRKIR